MFEILASIFMIYLMIVLFPVFLAAGAVALACVIATLTWLKEKLLNQ